MQTDKQLRDLYKLTGQRYRFAVRRQFFARCVRDIDADFNKQYGPFYRDWELVRAVCAQSTAILTSYLNDRDRMIMECVLLLGARASVRTMYARKRVTRRFATLRAVSHANDMVILDAFDEQIFAIKTAYRTLIEPECAPEE